MATFTQEKQPYGPLVRREIVIGRETYVVLRSDMEYPKGRYRWNCGIKLPGGAIQWESHVSLLKSEGMVEAVKRLLGR